MNSLPREFIHEFSRHHDTHDTIHPVGEVTISSHHQHCDFLQIGIEPYEVFVTSYIAPVQTVIWVFQDPACPAPAHAVHRNLPPRAPPVMPVLSAPAIS
ncbi:hypothetical protein [Chitinophaga sp. CB10]|uniref:hypothetical protein n=1 Tax=Chitinophaga sp. CB10 TaxID=1891659 RepID=UPI0025BDFE09|nr:hypothetical protein [Chitinophaga sp. CB10]